MGSELANEIAGVDPELLLGSNILVIFSEKSYEIKEILVRRGACAGCAPPKSATE